MTALARATLSSASASPMTYAPVPRGFFSLYNLIRDIPASHMKRVNCYANRHKAKSDFVDYLKRTGDEDAVKKIQGDLFVPISKLEAFVAKFVRTGPLEIDCTPVDASRGVLTVHADGTVTISVAADAADPGEGGEDAGAGAGAGAGAADADADADAAVAEAAGAEADEEYAPAHPPPGTFLPIDSTFTIMTNGDERSVRVRNRQEDGYFSANGFYAAFRTAYFAKLAMTEEITNLGVAEGDVMVREPRSSNLGVWIAPELARKMAIRAGFSVDQMRQAFEPDVTPVAVGDQPTLEDEGSAKLLRIARHSRPVVPGHTISREFVKTVDGIIIRISGTFVDASLLFKSANTLWHRFCRVDSNRNFITALVNKRGVPSWRSLIVFGEGTPGWGDQTYLDEDIQCLDIRNVFVDWALGLKMCAWACPTFDVEVMDLIAEYLVQRVDNVEICAVRALMPLESGVAEPNQQTHSQRPNVRERRAHLEPIPGIRPVYVPRSITSKPGGYAGVLGMETRDGVIGVRGKIGEASQSIDARWSTTGTGHRATSENAQLLWAATPTTTACTPSIIQATLKDVLRSQWCVSKGVVMIANTQNEEYWCPFGVYTEVSDYVTRFVENQLGPDIIGAHSERQRTASNDASVQLELSREETKRLATSEETKRLAASEETKRLADEHLFKIKMAMIDKGYNVDDIIRLSGAPLPTLAS